MIENYPSGLNWVAIGFFIFVVMIAFGRGGSRSADTRTAEQILKGVEHGARKNPNAWIWIVVVIGIILFLAGRK